MIYADIISIFLKILEILNGAKNEKRKKWLKIIFYQTNLGNCFPQKLPPFKVFLTISLNF